MASQEKVVPEKKGVPKKRETEERGCQDDAIKTESEVANKQQPPPPPVGPVSPVPPPISAPLPPEVCTITVVLILTIIIHVLYANIMYNLIILVIEEYYGQ